MTSKRSHDDVTYDGDDDGHDDGRGTSRPFVHGSRRTSRGSSSSETELWLRCQYTKWIEELNRSTASVLRNIEPTPENRVAIETVLLDHLRIENEARQRFGTTAGIVVTCGANDLMQLGHIHTTEHDVRQNFPPRAVRYLCNKKEVRVRSISCGGVHSMVLQVDGTPLTFGSEDDGVLGREMVDENSQKTPLPVTGFISSNGENENSKICQIVAGNCHCLFLSTSGNVYQCGMYKDEDSGKFCDLEEPILSEINGNSCNKKPVHVSSLTQRVAKIFSGQDSNFSAALLDDGTLVTWGFGNFGELGRSADMVQPDPEKGTYDVSRAAYVSAVNNEKVLDQAMIRDKFLTPSPVRFAGILPTAPKPKVISVACGENHLVVAARDPGQIQGSVYTCGLNSFGQLGNGQVVSMRDFGSNPSLILMAHELTKVKALEHENIAQVAAGEKHTLALTLDGMHLFSWGRADYGQLGIGYKKIGGKEALGSPQTVQFQLKDDGTRVIIRSISAGTNVSMCITDDGDLFTWGLGDETKVTGHAGEPNVYYPKKLDFYDTLKELSNNNISPSVTTRTLQADGGNNASMFLIQPAVFTSP